MNDATKFRIRRELAERMGWTVKEFKHSFELCWPDGTFLQNPFGDSYPASFTSESDAWQYAPDPFTDHADCAALVTWLAGQEHYVQEQFHGALVARIAQYGMVPGALEYLTSPLETRVLAACAALGISTGDE